MNRLMPRWRGWACGSVLTSRATQLPSIPLEIQVFVAVDHVVVAVAPRGGADGLQVGAGIRLGQREAAAHLAAGEARQPVPLLRRVPNFSTASASIRCELKMPVTAIHIAAMRMTISA